ncbi:uncharacterized protein LOC134807485 isoform X2 [Pan troglodytes]|uniref:uncharacterized protein LOC134807485 isoform X2 n=1 Tax=Pan troglodytes TaxID=9598 RepID=UPI003014102D
MWTVFGLLYYEKTEAKAERCYIASFEDGGKRSQTKEGEWCLEVGKGMETHSSVKHLERNTVFQNVDLSQAMRTLHRRVPDTQSLLPKRGYILQTNNLLIARSNSFTDIERN